MHIVICGLTLSSSWGNGHATLWRGMLKALAARGHTATFYEKDVSYYAAARDGWEPPHGVRLRLYSASAEIESELRNELRSSDVAIATSFCADGREMCRTLLDSPAAVKVFYDLDTPVTLDALAAGSSVAYLPAEGLGAFDLVLSYTGGTALDGLRSYLGVRLALPLYGWVDPEIHRAAPSSDDYRCALSYLGTFAADREPLLQKLFLEPARKCPADRFLIAGAQYPQDFPWGENVYFVRHLPPDLHPAFFCSCRATLNITRRAMAAYGFCPSGRLFEAAACGAPIITDYWEGLDSFFAPGSEVLTAACAQDVLDALSLSDGELHMIADAARERVLEHHTASVRAIELENMLEAAWSRAQSIHKLQVV